MWIKICGITSLDDAELALGAGADAIGLNLVPESPRYLTLEQAAELARAVSPRVRVVAVVADRSQEELRKLRRWASIDWLQLHGSEPPELVRALQPHAYKAVRIADGNDAARAQTFPGELLLADAKVAGVLGGSGRSFDWSLVRGLARERPLILAGGLNPGNVADALARVSPWGLDVASGVELEGEPRRKDPEKLARFVTLARAAALMLGLSSCATAAVRGGDVLARGRVPPGQVLAQYRSESCRDAKGAEAARASTVRLIREPGGRNLVVELRGHSPSLVARNSFSSGPEQVFQVVLEPASEPIVLHEFHLPAAPDVPGRLVTARRWHELSKSDDEFRAYADDVVVTCSLVKTAVER